MADFYGDQSVTFRDQRGFQTTVHARVHSTVSEAALLADASSFVTYISAASEGQVVRTGGLYIVAYSSGYGSAGGYPDIAMKCRLFGVTPSGNKTRFDIPAPLANCFLADGYTLDPATNTGIAGLIAMAAGGTWVQNRTNSGFIVVGGYFKDNKKRRRIIPGVLNPAGTGPA